MTTTDRLATHLTPHLQRGFAVTPTLIQTIESLCGLVSAVELRQLVAGESLGELGLAELLFVPDAAARLAVVDDIPDEGLAAAAIDALTARLVAAGVRAPVILADGEPPQTVVLDRARLAPYIAGLHLDYALPLPDPCPGSAEMQRQTRLLLRRRASALDATGRSFIQRLIAAFLDREIVDDALYLRALDYALTLLGNRPSGGNPLARLAAQKLMLQKELASLETFQETSSRFSMDYIMSQRLQVPTLNPDTAADEIFLIDRICMVVYGRLAEGLEPIQHIRMTVDPGDSDRTGDGAGFLL